MFYIFVEFQLLFRGEILPTQFASILLVTHDMSQILLLSRKEFSALFAGVPGARLVLLGMPGHHLRVLQDLAALETYHLLPHCVLAIVSPQTWSLDKFTRTKGTEIIIFSCGYVMDSFKMVYKLFSFCKFGVTLVTVIVIVTFNVFVQLKGCHKSFRALVTLISLFFAWALLFIQV